ncbi:MAG: glucosyl transferase [Ignavibacteriae bacterium]|nr:MAG: glucosyl transferase [Ignavibacteriota bacterium]
MAHKIFLYNFFILPFLFSCCNSIESPNDVAISLSLEDVSSTESWITLTTTNLQLPTTITLKQNNQTKTTINLVKADTLLYIDSLLPNATYTFQAISNQYQVSSNQLQITTLDTTSHNFTWQTWTFGEHSSSVLYDVAIIDENNIWAIGEIYKNDTLGQPDPNAYNAAHWDGTNWELKRIYFPTVCGSTSLTPYPAKAIFAFNDGQIWISSTGDKIAILMEGNQLNQFCLPPSVSMSINKIWGSSSNDLYVVGSSGNIAWYNGSQWTKIESGTELHLYDIYGDYSEMDVTYEILVTAANRSVSSEKEILKISNTTTVTPLVTDGIPYSIREIWFKAGKKYYVCGAGLFSKNNIETNESWKELTVNNVYHWSIDGNELNDIVICGAFGELLHYNGVSWRSYSEMPGGSLLISTKIKDDLVVTVGIENPRAFIAIGRR